MGWYGGDAYSVPSTGCQNSSHLGASVTFTMSFTFSFEEYADMIYVYGFCDGNSVLAVGEYQQRFPNRRIPNRRVFTGVYQALRDTSRLPGVRIAAERGVNEGVNEEGIVHMVHRSPRTSMRRIARRLRVPHTRVWRTLLAEGMYPYHVQRVQPLRPGDFAERLNFCKWLNCSRQLHRYIMFTDEAQFNRDGVNNTHNSHVYTHPDHQQATSSVLYTTSCKHSLALLRMGEIIARNMLS